MLDPELFEYVQDLEENINEIVLEEECKEFISFNKNYMYQFKNLFDNIGKLIFKLDDDIKYNIHKFLTNNINNLHVFKTKTLLPCYLAIFYLYKKKIILNVNASKYLFNIDIKQNKILTMFENINKISKTNITFNKNNLPFLIKGWSYLITQNLDDDILFNFLNDLTYRLILLNLKNKKDKRIIPIPCHFEIYKQIDIYIFIILYFINHYRSDLFSQYKENIRIIYDYILDNNINKSHYKITYTKYVIDNYIKHYVK